MKVGSGKAYFSSLDKELHDDFLRLDEEEFEWTEDNLTAFNAVEDDIKDIYLNYAIRMKNASFGMHRQP